MNPPLLSRRSSWIAAGLLALLLAALAARLWLGDYVLRTALGSVGASEIRYRVLRGTPWRAEIDDLSFRVRTQPFAARHVVIERPHWWSATLGRVRIEGAEIPVVIDGSDVDPWNWKRYGNDADPGAAMNLPLETLDFDGRLVVQMSNLPDMPIQVHLEGRPRSGTSWIGSLLAEGEGFRLAGNGTLLRAGQELDFQVLSSELDLGVWSAQVQRLAPLPGRPWELGGKLTGVAEGHVTANRFAATARVSWRHGVVAVPLRQVRAEGIEADLEFSDLWKFRTRAAELRVGQLTVGRLRVDDIQGRGGLAGARTIVVDGLQGRALGGGLGTGAFRCYLDQTGLQLDVQASGLDATQVAALLETPVAVRGRVDANFPLSLQPSGVRFGTGSAEFRADGTGALRFSPAALLRAGATVDEASLRVLKAAGGEPQVARIDGLRLELRPPDAPLGSSARVRLNGALPGGDFSAVLNLSGAVETYLDLQRRRD